MDRCTVISDLCAKTRLATASEPFKQNGNVLIFPAKIRIQLPTHKGHSGLTIRATLGKSPWCSQNPSLVGKGIPSNLSDSDVYTATGHRVISSATSKPTTMVRVRAKDDKTKQELLKHGLRIEQVVYAVIRSQNLLLLHNAISVSLLVIPLAPKKSRTYHYQCYT